MIKELSEAFKPRGWLLSAAVSANPTNTDAGHDVPQLAQYLDWISLMTYAYYDNFNGLTRHHSPLYAFDNLNVDFTVKYWIQKGAHPRKLIMGIPSYGQSMTLTDSTNHGLNVSTSGPGQ